MRLRIVLDRISGLIVQACNPDKIVLFGSHSKGQENLESDLDILVIGSFQESRFLRDRELRQLLHGYPIRIDLHLVAPSEIAAEASKPFGFLSSALAHGMTLYEKGCD